MNKRRLLKLADLLEADAKNKKGIRFDFHTWGRVEDQNDPVSCGAVACAAGLAAISGAFKRQGLSYRLRTGLFGSVLLEITLHGKCRSSRNYDGSFLSACKFFGLSYREGKWLFLESRYCGPTTGAKGERAVAKRIRDFVAGKARP